MPDSDSGGVESLIMSENHRKPGENPGRMKILLFLAGLVVLLVLLNRLTMPEYCPPGFAATTTYASFYRMPRHSMNVVFLGASRAACSFDPAQLWLEHGIAAWNLGCDQQNLLVSYYWLQEALQSQNLQAVVLDSKLLFSYNQEEALNAAEECTRKGIDSMHWSPVKIEAVHDICRLDPKQTVTSYYCPLFRFHDRWRYLNENDFLYREKTANDTLKGFVPLDAVCGDTSYQPWMQADAGNVVPEAAVPVMQVYLDRIAALCREYGIRLILVSVPYIGGTPGRAHTARDYANNRGIEYYDFNGEDLYRTIGYDFPNDQADATHPNVHGAQKLTAFIGTLLAGPKNEEE
jgi:hypothetical protein